MITYNENTRIFTATGRIVDTTTSLSSSLSGGSYTIYHFLLAVDNVEKPDLLCFASSTFEQPHLPLPFLARGQLVTVQYSEKRHMAQTRSAKEAAAVGSSLELHFLELDWNSTPHMETAKEVAEGSIWQTQQ